VRLRKKPSPQQLFLAQRDEGETERGRERRETRVKEDLKIAPSISQKPVFSLFALGVNNTCCLAVCACVVLMLRVVCRGVGMGGWW
jgi:hypothetical protein